MDKTYSYSERLESCGDDALRSTLTERRMGLRVLKWLFGIADGTLGLGECSPLKERKWRKVRKGVEWRTQ